MLQSGPESIHVPVGSAFLKTSIGLRECIAHGCLSFTKPFTIMGSVFIIIAGAKTGGSKGSLTQMSLNE